MPQCTPPLHYTGGATDRFFTSAPHLIPHCTPHAAMHSTTALHRWSNRPFLHFCTPPHTALHAPCRNALHHCTTQVEQQTVSSLLHSTSYRIARPMPQCTPPLHYTGGATDRFFTSALHL